MNLSGTVTAPRKSDGLARADEEGAAERNEFVSEGQIEIGPSERFFVFLDGEYLGQAPFDYFGLPEERAAPTWGASVSPWGGWGRRTDPRAIRAQGTFRSPSVGLAGAL